MSIRTRLYNNDDYRRIIILRWWCWATIKKKLYTRITRPRICTRYLLNISFLNLNHTNRLVSGCIGKFYSIITIRNVDGKVLVKNNQFIFLVDDNTKCFEHLQLLNVLTTGCKCTYIQNFSNFDMYAYSSILRSTSREYICFVKNIVTNF